MTSASSASLAQLREPKSHIDYLRVLAAILARQAARDDVAAIRGENRGDM
jgi:hypothetical protein